MISDDQTLACTDTPSPLQLITTLSLDEESTSSSPIEFLPNIGSEAHIGGISNGKKKLESVKIITNDTLSERKVIHRGGFKMPGK